MTTGFDTGNPATAPVWRHQAAAWALAAVCLVLGGAPPAAAAPRDRWLEIRSANFVVAGNAREKNLRRAADDLEALRAALTALYPGLDSSHPTRVVVLQDHHQFARFLPRDAHGRPQPNVGGYFLAAPDVNFIVFGESGTDNDRRVVLHEYAHHVLRRAVRALPLWLNEGLAEFYSTFDHDSRLAPAIVGRPPADVLAVLRSSAFVPLDRIVATTPQSAILSDIERARVFYAESWALVHHLMIERPGPAQERMTALIDALTRGMAPADAFVSAFGVSLDRLDDELRRYARQATFRGLAIDPGSRQVADAPSTEMSPAAVARLRGELLLRVGSTDEAERELAAALAIEPSNVEGRVAMARAMLAKGHREDGRALLEQAAAAAPDNFSAQYYLGGQLAAQRRYYDAFLCFDRTVRLREHSVSALFAFSSVALALGLDDASEEALRLSMAEEANPEAYRTRAYTALGLGRDGAAARDAVRYIDAVGWNEPAAQSTALVAAMAYQRAQRPVEAAAILAHVRAVSAASSWPGLVAGFMQGDVPPDSLLASAKTQEEQTAAHIYIGLKAEVAGHRDEAMAHFRWVMRQGARQDPGYGVAIEELVRIETDERR